MRRFSEYGNVAFRMIHKIHKYTYISDVGPPTKFWGWSCPALVAGKGQLEAWPHPVTQTAEKCCDLHEQPIIIDDDDDDGGGDDDDNDDSNNILVTITTASIVTLRPGATCCLESSNGVYASLSFNMLKHLHRAGVLRFPKRRTLNTKH